MIMISANMMSLQRKASRNSLIVMNHYASTAKNDSRSGRDKY
jgi:hypothetical protein